MRSRTAAARGVLWALAVAVDYTAIGLGFPTPGLGRARASEFAIAAEHLAERYRQFFIIALGELILVTGLAFSSSGFAADRSAAVVVAFATTALLWRIYIYRAGELLARGHRSGPRPGPRCRLGVYAHLVMVAGIVAHRRRRRTRHRPPTRTHPTGLDRRHPRRTRAVPRRTGHLRVRGVRPRVPGPVDRASSCWPPSHRR